MPRKAPEPDLEACWAALPPEKRAAIALLADYLPPGGWRVVPGLRQQVVLNALMRVEADMSEAGAGNRLRAAAELLGLEDDSDLAAHPADRYLRTLRRWVADAYAADIDDRAADDIAA